MKILCLLMLCIAFITTADGVESRHETYKTVGEVKLDLLIQIPDGWKAEDLRPAVVFFFGGGWTGGSPKQFDNQCRYLVSRGIIAMEADFRTGGKHRVKPITCVEDAKSALRWVRANSKRLGIDPKRIAAAGGSSGGHMAASVALLPGLNDPADDLHVSCVPNALLLYNPALIIAPVAGIEPKALGFAHDATPEKFGCNLEDISPFHHIGPGAPPTIIFHGQADTVVPYSTVELFRDRMVKAGNRCDLVGYEWYTHGFFNFTNGDNSKPIDVMKKTDEFLASLGWLAGSPTIADFFKK